MKCKKLIYRSPIFGSVQCEELPDEDSRCVDFGPDTAYRLYVKGPEVEMFLTEHCEDLAQHVPEELEGLVVRADFGSCELAYDKLFLITEVYVRQEPTDLQAQQIIDWIEGQMSDGWGEGLEQRHAYHEVIYAHTHFFDDFKCEFDADEIRCDVYYYLHPWANDITWSVTLVDFEDVDLDIEEPDPEKELRETLLKVKELIDEIVEELKKVP